MTLHLVKGALEFVYDSKLKGLRTCQSWLGTCDKELRLTYDLQNDELMPPMAASDFKVKPLKNDVGNLVLLYK